MARVFNDWYLGLSGEEQRAFHAEQSETDDAAREEWEATNGRPAEPEPVRPVRRLTKAEFDAALAAIDADIPF